MQLSDAAVTTPEVKSWQGLHLLHFQGSACSQKVRIFLAEKGLMWESHPVDLLRQAHATPWFLGINPRGVVPVLVHDGVVHVESNDIMEYLDELPSPVPSFFPQNASGRARVRESLALEDSLHMDLRTITMGFLVPYALAKKSPKVLEAYEQSGAPDTKRDKEVAWWRAFAKDGVPPDQARASLRAFAAAFDTLEQWLRANTWLIGQRISVLEIAWFISLHRLVCAGYPIKRHPRLKTHYESLLKRPSFAQEITTPGLPGLILSFYSGFQRLRGHTLARTMAEA